jgi:homocysteine S-methyltransferase
MDRVAAVGVNCTPPKHITSLIREIRAVTGKPIVVYPNSGERYDAAANRWLGDADEFALIVPEWVAPEWVAAGATVVGGCCRIGPEQIRQLRRQLSGKGKSTD